MFVTKTHKPQCICMCEIMTNIYNVLTPTMADNYSSCKTQQRLWQQGLCSVKLFD